MKEIWGKVAQKGWTCVSDSPAAKASNFRTVVFLSVVDVSSRIHDPTDVTFDRGILAVSGFPFPGLVFRDVTRVLDDRVEAVLLFTASRMVSAKRWQI